MKNILVQIMTSSPPTQFKRFTHTKQIVCISGHQQNFSLSCYVKLAVLFSEKLFLLVY